MKAVVVITVLVVEVNEHSLPQTMTEHRFTPIVPTTIPYLFLVYIVFSCISMISMMINMFNKQVYLKYYQILSLTVQASLFHALVYISATRPKNGPKCLSYCINNGLPQQIKKEVQ